MSKVRFFHLVNALIGIGIGLYCLILPEATAAALGIAFQHPTGLTDFRATYGGLTLACGIFFALAYGRIVEDKAGLWFSMLFYAGFGFVRLFGILSDGSQKPLMYGFLLAELAFFSVSAVLLKNAK